MTDQSAELSVIERLTELLDGGLLPAGGPAETAERLIERLKRPARVALLGLPGSGKSAILNLLAGIIVVPETLRLPTIVVQYGQQERMLCTLADGRTEVIAGTDLEQVLTRNPAMVTLERDLPALKVISLLEVSAGPMDAEQRRAAQWASKRADIVIWCTTSYLPKEQVVWESMPAAIKENGFLLLAKSDLLGGTEAVAGMLERVEQRAGEDFRQVFAISARMARAAMPSGGAVDREKFRESGAGAVILAIKSRVQAARRADSDTAEVLVARHALAGELVARRFANPAAEAPVPEPGWTPPPDPVADVGTPSVPTAPKEPVEDDVMAKILARVAAEDTRADAAPARAARGASADPQTATPSRYMPGPAVEEPPGTGVPRPEDPFDPAALAAPGGRRLSERLRQTPDPEAVAAAASMPLRTTWKSPTEAAQSRPGATRPPPGPPVVRKDVERFGSATQPQARAVPEPAPSAPAPEAAQTGSGPAASVPPAAAPTERVSVFSAKAPVAEAPRSTPARTVPGEPLTRVRAPAPTARAVPAQRPIAPEDLASPKTAQQRDRQVEGGAERRERPRISARVAVSPTHEGQSLAEADLMLLDQAIGLIMSRAGELLSRIDPAGKLAVDAILDHGRKTIETVTELLSRGTSPGLRRISTGLGDVLDLIMLMQLEKGHAPADDTLTLILQIRRDLEILRAA